MNRNLFGLFGWCAVAWLSIFLSQQGWAQEGIVIPISDGGTVTVDCDATELIYFTDDNSGGVDFQDPYSNNNFTITLCPSTPGDAVQVNFLAFDLQTNANPNNNDVLYAFNGDDTSADLVGAGTGNSFVGVSITASIDNPTGCVTFSLVVNNNATGGDQGWVAQVTCVTPCSYPEAGISLVSPEPFPDNEISVGVCPNELVTFDASASLPGAPEFPVDSLIWNWGDGSVEITAVSDGWQQSHSFPEPGEYIVTLVVQDINNCNSTNLLPHQVLVSTIPIFNTDVTTPLCEDAPGYLNGNPVQSITWTALPPVGVSELADLPDATGVAFTSELFIDFFDTDQVLEDCDDIELITANIEHSFIGDLSFWITCPDGTEVLLMDNGASGGPDPSGCTPNDLGGNDLGIVDTQGFDYSWNMDAEWVLDDANNPNAANPMPSGTYLPCGDLCDFVGCPLNGIWTFNVIDQWAADNGTLYEWGIDFNPEIVPGVTTFTPIIGLDSDSSYWHPVGDLENILNTGDLGVVGVSEDGNYIDLLFPDPGTFEFGYVVTNNFGCTWDTTLTVEVIENPGTFITAGPDQIFCSTPVQLEGGLDTGSPSACGAASGSFDYCYSANDNSIFSYCPDVLGDGTMMTISFSAGQMEAGWDFVTVYDGPNATGPVLANLDAAFAGQSFTATNPDGCISFQFSADGGCDCAGFCNFEPIEWCVSCAGSSSTCGYDWLWEPSEYLNDPTLAQPTVIDFDGTPIEFTLYVEPVGFDNCQATDVVTVGPGFDFDVDFQQPTCFANDGIIDVAIFEDANDAAGPFTIQLFVDGPGGPDLIEELVWDNLTDFYYNDLVPGDYTVVVFDNIGCIYSLPVLLEDPLPLTLDIPNIQTICLGGSANLQVSSPQDPLNVWTYVWDNGLPNGPVQQVTPNTSTVYTVQGFDVNGCPTDEYQVGVNVLSAINADLVASDFLCSGEEAYLDASASNGGSGVGYTYTWTFEGNILNEDEESIWTIPPSTGEYCVTVADNCETPSATVCTDVVLESPVPIAFSADTTEACGTGTFLFTNETNPALITSSLWAFGDGTYAGESNTVKTFQQPGFYDVSLTVTSLAGGCAYTQVQEAYISVYPIPQVGFFAGPQPTRAPDTDITFDGYSNASVVEWFWTFNTFNPLGYSFEQDPTFQFPPAEGGIYPVQLQITDTHGCVNVVNRQIEIQSMFNLFIPTSFTPNNDGHNDAFFVEGTDIDPDRFEFEIWNRWGELIWSTTNPDDAWYGQVGDEGQYYVPNGPYSYRIEVHSLEEESYRKEVFGVVTIIR